MDLLLSAKAGDVTVWRAAEDFTAAYRQALLDLAASDRSGSTETVFSETCAALETAITTHQKLVKRLGSLIDDVAAATPSTNLKELTISFYDDLYRHFEQFRSAPAFYQLSMAYLRQASATIIAHATAQLGPHAGHLPKMSLIAIGPAGRGEYSPFCPLQILLVHDEVAAPHLQTINLFCHILHSELENAGFIIDPVVTPRNAQWRGTLAEWRRRCEFGQRPRAVEASIDLYRLVDQYPLYFVKEHAGELKQMSSNALGGNRPAVTNVITRMASLSNGLGFMGRLKRERSGSRRGMFRLLDHGLLPFSVALSTLALIKESPAIGTCERIRDLLRRRELDVELAERMLATWHTLNDLRLWLERSFHINGQYGRTLFLNPDELTADRRQMLKDALESIALIQRHVENTFSGMGE